MSDEIVVALVTPWESKGGIVSYAERLKGHLEDRDIEVRVVPIERRETANPLHHVRLVDRIPEEADLIHVQFEAGIFGRLGMSGIGAPAFFARLSRDSRPVVTTLHEVHRSHEHRGRLGNTLLKWRDAAIERLALRVSAATVVHTREAKQVLQERHGDGFRVERMLHPVESNAELIDQDRAKGELSLSGPVALTFGWVEPKKRYQEVVRVLDHFPDLTYVIAGEPRDAAGRSHLADTLALASDLGVEDRVQHRGYVPEDEVPLLFSAADVVVLPYDRVAQSGVVNDALAYHRPVITSKLPAFEELEAEFDCLLTYAGRDELRSVMHAILGEEFTRKQLEERASEYVDSVSWEAFAYRTHDLYREISSNID